MFVIRCVTAQFEGKARFACHHCGRRVDFPGDCAVALLIFPHTIHLWDVVTGTVLHDCAISPPELPPTDEIEPLV